MTLPAWQPPGGFLDAHCHLHDADLRAALRAAAPGDLPGIGAQLVNGTHPGDWAEVAGLQATGSTLLLKAYGVHPWKVDGLRAGWELDLRRHLGAGAASVGEIGLDHWIEPRDERLQVEVFQRQLAIAHELRLVPTIHCLRAWGMLLDCLRAGPPMERGFLVHGFGGSVEVLRQLLDLGGHFSFSAYAADPGRKRMRDAARACPLDRLLAETDAPDMVPPVAACRFPLTGPQGERLHHPAEIATAYAFLAEWRGDDPDALAAAVAANFHRLFNAGPV